MGKMFFGLVTVLFCSFISFGQGTITGKIVDSASQKALAFATVSVFKASDTTLLTYRLTTPEGEYKVPGIPVNMECRVVISFSGYDVFRKEFVLQNNETLDIGTVSLSPIALSLDEVLVVAERPPVTFRRDTIEFNASSFKTLPTALVEDLLRKLPGVQVDKEGNVLVNGRRVNRILVDGKSFFGDDPKMATRNLPANLIDKVQVADDKEEADRNTDGDLTNIGKVINLTLRKGVKQGWFGKAYAGAGTKDRYEGGGIANIYRDTLQLSVLAFSNNVNRSGFSMKDVQELGGFNRSGANSMMMMRRGGSEGFAINGISFGGLEQGIARSSGAGFNLNHAPSKRFTFFGQYFYGNNKSDALTNNNILQFINDTIIDNNTLTHTLRNVNTHTVSTGLNAKPDSLLDVNFKANYSNSGSDNDVDALQKAFSNVNGDLSKGVSDQANEYKNHELNQTLFITKRFRAKKGRTLNISQFMNYRKNQQENLIEAINEFYVPFTTTEIFEQLRLQEVPTFNTSLSANFAEPLNKKLTFRFNNRVEYIHDQQDVNTFGRNGSTKEYDQYKSALSTGYEREQKKLTSTVSFTYKIKEVNLTAGVSGLLQDIDNEFKQTSEKVGFSLFNLLPTFSLTWKRLSVRFDQTVSAPGINNLSPVPDISNRFFERYGNPFLQPAERSSMNAHYYNFNPKTNINLNFYFNGSITDNDVIMAREVTSTGIQKVTPVNADGSKQFYMYTSFGKQFKYKQKFTYSFAINNNISFDELKLIVNNNVGQQTAISYYPYFNIGLNWNDIIELRPEYRLGLSKTKYTDPAFKNLNVTTHNIEGELIIRWPKKLVWETNLLYSDNGQSVQGMPRRNRLWNAAVTFLMLKDDKGQLKFSVFDILNQNTNIYRYATQNYITTQQSNVLQRYGLLTFTYNIRSMGAQGKVGGRERLFRF